MSFSLLELYTELKNSLCEEYRSFAPSFEEFENIYPENSFLLLKQVVLKRTKSFSVTNNLCQQNCAHCNGHYLNGMDDRESIRTTDFSDYDSVLISGGGNSQGEVPIKEHLETLKLIPKRILLNIHPGYQPPENLKGLPNKTVISFDIPSCDDTVKFVYKQNRTAEDYRKLFLEYEKHFKTIPHLTIGLGNNTLSGEKSTIDFVSKHSSEGIVFIVFRPTKDTEMAEHNAPSMGHLHEILMYGKTKLKQPITLGCMRPSRLYRKNLDIIYWMHGVNKIVMPHRTLTTILKKHQVKISIFNNCCALNI
ncbi:MAG: hypothetical protein PHF29_06025 [Candidatus Riflebacteria bacterium]|nr:hypothetical protein [Candidatus Riflebacteria bacterium]